MAQTNSASESRGAQGRYRTMLGIWIFFIISIGMLFLVTSLLRPTPEGNDLSDTTTIWLYVAAGVFMVLVSFVLKFGFLHSANRRKQPATTQVAYILALAFCDMAAIFGITAYLVTNSRYAFLLFLIAGLGAVLHKPRREHFQGVAS